VNHATDCELLQARSGSSRHGIWVADWTRRPDYLIRRLVPVSQIIAISVGEPGQALLDTVLRRDPQARAILVHIDASQPDAFVGGFEDLCCNAGSAGIAVWNGAVRDIRKRSLQQQLRNCELPTVATTFAGDPAELLIIKTDLNSRGISEWSLTATERARLGWPPPRKTVLDGLTTYQVKRRAEVPKSWWNDPDLAVERFVENPDGRIARVYFAGEQVSVSTGRVAGPVRRMNDAVDRFDYLADRSSLLDPRVAELMGSATLAAALSALAFATFCGLDFGAIDLVFDGAGLPYIVDLNLTPYWGSDGGDDKLLAHLRKGLVLVPGGS
jgi:hypothetical protein